MIYLLPEVPTPTPTPVASPEPAVLSPIPVNVSFFGSDAFRLGLSWALGFVLMLCVGYLIVAVASTLHARKKGSPSRLAEAHGMMVACVVGAVVCGAGVAIINNAFAFSRYIH